MKGILYILLFIVAGALVSGTKEKGPNMLHPTDESTEAALIKSTPKLIKSRKENDPHNNTEVIAQLGGTAALRCHTLKMPDQLVTWMKRGDEQLLTAGLQVYSSERRYSAAHLRHQKVWELRIRDVKLTDAGSYECQITTHPPVSILFTLRVVEARAVISGPSELHVHEGSRLKLQCHVDLATEPPLYVFWFHNETMINFEAKRPLRVTKQHSTSSLTITNVSRADAGTYRCEPHLALADNVTLHVVAGENSAAMQKGSDIEDGTHFAQTSSGSHGHPAHTHLLFLMVLAAIIIMRTSYKDLSLQRVETEAADIGSNGSSAKGYRIVPLILNTPKAPSQSPSPKMCLAEGYYLKNDTFSPTLESQTWNATSLILNNIISNFPSFPTYFNRIHLEKSTLHEKGRGCDPRMSSKQFRDAPSITSS